MKNCFTFRKYQRISSSVLSSLYPFLLSTHENIFDSSSRYLSKKGGMDSNLQNRIILLLYCLKKCFSRKLTWSCCFLLVKFLLPSPYRSAFLSEKDSASKRTLLLFFRNRFCLSIKSTFKKAVKKLTPSFLALHQGVKISEMAFCFPTKNCISILKFFFSPNFFAECREGFFCVLKSWKLDFLSQKAVRKLILALYISRDGYGKKLYWT